jgi:hypothetical protein
VLFLPIHSACQRNFIFFRIALPNNSFWFPFVCILSILGLRTTTRLDVWSCHALGDICFQHWLPTLTCLRIYAALERLTDKSLSISGQQGFGLCAIQTNCMLSSFVVQSCHAFPLYTFFNQSLSMSFSTINACMSSSTLEFVLVGSAILRVRVCSSWTWDCLVVIWTRWA